MNTLIDTAPISVAAEQDSIATEHYAECYLCGIPGHRLYSDLSDRLFGVPGKWGLLRCSVCGLVWLSPRPALADLGKIYRNYYTHSGPGHWYTSIWEETRRALYAAAVPGYDDLVNTRLWRAIGKGLTRIPTLKERALLGTMCLSGRARGRLLDIGCGNGAFLARMREAGWQVFGIEPDCAAARQARERYGIKEIFSSIDYMNHLDGSFDAVTLSHVIEHVYDPVDLLSQCRRLLKRDGLVVVLTPNIDSLGHHVFKSSWYALDPPRHLYLFSSTTLKACCEKAGLHVNVLRTSARMAHWIGPASEAIRNHGVFDDSTLTWRNRLSAVAFQAREELALRSSIDKGEELVLVASRIPAEESGPNTFAPNV